MKNKKILLVDDDPQQLKLIQLYLSKKKYILETAKSGKGALHLLKKKSYNLVLTDMQMPEMDGLTLFYKTRKDLKLDTPFIIATAYTNLGELEAKANSNSFIIIQKPFTAETILKSIKKALKK